ncbi:MAG: T9SS type A sorting domain-containing protein [Flavobacteriales bacterium]|nr:T9SS type A sorting domain-containing protein [Flavobacteriales bacterium]
MLKIRIKSTITFVLMLAMYHVSVSQTGPGGVGSSTTNVLWLEADNISSLVDGDDITTWADGSGNSNDLSQSNASFKPVYKTNILNGFPAVRFNKSNGRIRKTGFASFPTSAITAIYVNINSESNDALLSYASTGSYNDFLLFNSDDLGIYRGSNINSNISFNNNVFHIVNASWRSSDGSVELWKDGTQSYTTTGFQSGTSITAGGCLAIAGEQDGIDASYDAAQDHLGDFTEVMIFNTYLNTAQQIIVANYLAAKYNLTIANDRYAYQATHSFDVAGIGRENASNTHTTAMSANVLQVQNASGLDVNQEYLLFGHNNGDISTAWTTTEAPNSGVNIQRLSREWRLDETGDVGTVDFLVDVAGMPALPGGHTMYALMVDADGDFSNGASVYELSLASGTTYDAINVVINDGDYVAIAAVDPRVEHTLTASSDFEPNNAVVEVSLNFIPRTAKTVDYTTTDGTALTAQPDYTGAAASTVTIPAGSSTANYTILITNDIAVESSETFTVTLSNPSVGLTLGTNSVHTYTIQDDDNSRKVYFDFATSNGSEATTPAIITLSINNVDNTNPTTVDYSVTGGTATGGGTDYTLASGTVTFLAGVTTGSFNITINNDALYENNETIMIALSNPTNCNLDGTAPLGGTGFISHTYTITENDIPPTIQFNSTTSNGLESVTSVSFQLDLNLASGIDASVTYTLSGSATGGGTDYTLANGTATISTGNTTVNINATIVDDALEELNETMILTLSLPVNATLGANQIHTYTITDNEEFGYLGPGGVGQASNNKLWVKPNDLAVVADGTDVSSWADASGNGNDLSQGSSSFTPRYYANIVNGKPVVRFNQSNGRLIHNSFNDFPSTAITTIFVNSNNDSGDGLVSYASSASDNDYLLFSSNSVSFFRGGSTGTGTAINGNIFRVIGNTWLGSSGATRFYRNGTQTFSGTYAAGTSITTGGNLAIAGEQDAIDGGYQSTQSHQGDFAEIILYNVVLNSARRKIVDNYLSAKYNIAIANDLFSYDAPSTYGNEVAGIGRDDANNFHRDAKGTGMVRINTPSSLDDGDYLMWGHDNAIFSFNSSDIPAGFNNRLNRVWRIDETGDMGTVTVHFDLSIFTVGSSGDLVLLIDSDDGSFVNATQIPISSFAGSVATFNNVNFTAGNWFTIASTNVANPLPIELLSFEASASGNIVDLKWVTASELNSDFFTVERSLDVKNWEGIITTEAAGKSYETLTYYETDFYPNKGISYYRLRQTDINGDIDYSPIRSVNVNASTEAQVQVQIYPNPTKNEITIISNAVELEKLNIYNMLGQDVTALTERVKNEINQVVIDLSKLNEGMYYFVTLNTTSKVYKQ